jgi:hypothetical protein
MTYTGLGDDGGKERPSELKTLYRRLIDAKIFESEEEKKAIILVALQIYGDRIVMPGSCAAMLG